MESKCQHETVTKTDILNRIENPQICECINNWFNELQSHNSGVRNQKRYYPGERISVRGVRGTCKSRVNMNVSKAHWSTCMKISLSNPLFYILTKKLLKKTVGSTLMRSVPCDILFMVSKSRRRSKNSNHQITCKMITIKLTPDFTVESFQNRRVWCCLHPTIVMPMCCWVGEEAQIAEFWVLGQTDLHSNLQTNLS